MSRSDWSFHQLPPNIVHVVDLNLGNMSVTNDAEAVIAELHERIDLTDKLVQYTDSEGQIDRLLHENGVFTGFAFGRWEEESGSKSR